MAKLTPRQSELMDLIRHCGSLSIYGPKEFKTARSLARLGLINLDVYDIATIPAPEQPQ